MKDAIVLLLLLLPHPTHPPTHSGLASRKFFVGGNWKCNGSVAQVDVSVLFVCCQGSDRGGGSDACVREDALCIALLVPTHPPTHPPAHPLQSLVNMLNESKLASTTEVVIAPSSVHLHKALAKVRPDVAVAAQDVWTQGGE